MNWAQRFSKVRVLVVGDLVADHYVYGQTERVSREAPVLIVRHEREEVKLGCAANVAANAAALGGRVTAIGVLGVDPLGTAMRDLFKRNGMTLKAVRVPQTESKTRVLAGGVNTTRQQMLRIDRGATAALSTPARRALATAVTKAAARADVVIVSDYGAGVVCPEVKTALTRIARRVPVCVDSRYALASMRGFSVCKPNEPELAALTGTPVHSDAEVEQAIRVGFERLECELLLVTRGKRGMALGRRGAPTLFLPVHGQADAVDVTGAGDTVIASFALAHGAKASAEEAAYLANVAGSLVVQKQGTATVSMAELDAELSR